MARYAVIENGQVSRVFLATPEAIAGMIATERKKIAELEAAIDVTDATDETGVGIGKGHLYDAETRTFTAPPVPDEPEESLSDKARLAKLEAELAELKQAKR